MPAPGRDRWIAGEWASAFVRSVEDMTGQHTSFDISEATDAAPADAPVDFMWRRHTFDIPSSGPLWVGASSAAVSEIGTVILKAAGIDDADAQTVDGTFVEMLGQALGTLVRIMSASLSSEVKALESDDSPPDGPLPAFEVRINVGAPAPALVRIAVSASLTEAVSSMADAHEHTQPSAIAPTPAAFEGAVQRVSSPAPGHALDLLLDVELPVSVSFGRAQLALKDVIKLTTGSIVELNRSIAEPVEVIVNNCVIARGEVVVVEGNFGVRIQQVISRQERLRTLR